MLVSKVPFSHGVLAIGTIKKLDSSIATGWEATNQSVSMLNVWRYLKVGSLQESTNGIKIPKKQIPSDTAKT
jgi:hypothetical protein